MNLLLPTTVACLLITGMGLALLGSVKLTLAQKLRIDERQVGGLVSLFGFTTIPVILTAGFLTDLMGRHVILIGGTILMVLGLLTLAASHRYAMALVSVLLLSAAWAAQINVINVLVPHVLRPPSFLSEDIPAISFATNLGNVFFGLGAFLTPLLVSWALGRLGLAWGLRLLAGLVALQVVTAGFSDLPAAISAGAGGSFMGPETWSLLGDPIMWLCAMALFFLGPLEAAMGAWTTTFLGDRGVSEARATTLLSAFWLAYMASRVFTAFVLGPFAARLVSELGLEAPSEAVLILVLALGCVGVNSGVVRSRTRRTAAALVIAAGLILGPIFPSIMALLLGHFPVPVQGRAVGLLFAVGGLGWTLIPMAIGVYAQRTNVQRGFLVAVGSAVGLSLVAGLLTLASIST